jgi:hypothetical protein
MDGWMKTHAWMDIIQFAEVKVIHPCMNDI